MESLLTTFKGISGLTAYAIVFGILLACGLGVPIPEDITLILGGYLSYEHPHNTNVYVMILVAMVGVLGGDSIIFLLGNKYGSRLLEKRFFRKLIHADKIEIVKEKLHRQGNKVIFLARFMPGLRAPTYFLCGTLHLPYRVFFFFDGLAAIISVPLIVYATFHFGHVVKEVVSVVRSVEHGIALAIVLLVLLLVGKALWARRKRRLHGQEAH